MGFQSKNGMYIGERYRVWIQTPNGQWRDYTIARSVTPVITMSMNTMSGHDLDRHYDYILVMSNNTTSGSIHPLAEHYETLWS